MRVHIKQFLLLLILLIPQFCFSSEKDVFCASLKNQRREIELSYSLDYRMSFKNSGGIGDAGVCWWHNLFQRSAIYLTVFKPNEKKPTAQQARKMIHSIAAGKRVVEIPGYKNFYEFSKDWKKEIQKKLNQWQLVDGFLKFAWIRGLSGSHSENPDKILKTILTFDELVMNQNEVAWTMWQLKGITAHSALVTNLMNENRIYILDHIDSNFPTQTRQYTYIQGSKSSYEQIYGHFVNYTGRNKDIENHRRAQAIYCSNSISSADHDWQSTEPLSNAL